MIVAQFNWTAVKKSPNKHFQGEYFYDMYEWNPYKMKWVFLPSARFGDLIYADKCASARNDEIQTMFDSNKYLPPAMK